MTREYRSGVGAEYTDVREVRYDNGQTFLHGVPKKLVERYEAGELRSYPSDEPIHDESVRPSALAVGDVVTSGDFWLLRVDRISRRISRYRLSMSIILPLERTDHVGTDRLMEWSVDKERVFGRFRPVVTTGQPLPTPEPPEEKIAASLRRLKSLHDDGILTDDEYEEKRKRLTDQL